MDAQQRARFRQDGFLVIKNAISPDTVAHLNREFERSLAREMPPVSHIWPHRSRGGERW